jgi:hypothetical protein
MKKASTYRRSAGLVMAVVMVVHLFGGLGLLCANERLRSFRALGIDAVAAGITSSDNGSEEVSSSALDNAGSQGGTSKCCCKKHKRCPTIPRAAITSNPTQRFHIVQVEAKTSHCHFLTPEVTNHRFAARGDWPLMALEWCAPFSCSDPLALTSVLLI